MSYKPQKEFSIYESPNSFPSWNILSHRRAAAISLGKIGDTRAINPLKEILKDPVSSDEADVAVATALKTILGGTLPQPIEEELSKLRK